jgi:hypothetical protein
MRDPRVNRPSPVRGAAFPEPQHPTLDEGARVWLGSRRRYIIFELSVGVPFYVLMMYFYFQDDLLPYWFFVLLGGAFCAYGLAYYLGPWLRHRHPDPGDFL